jgi:tripartite-type tricarboxylate transporter receptor subunit TctC
VAVSEVICDEANRIKDAEMRMRHFCTTATLLIAAIGLYELKPAQAADARDFYRGKILNFVVSTAPGGGYDIYTRMIAQFLAKYIPSSPNIVAQNMPGAGGLRAERRPDDRDDRQYSNVRPPVRR